MPEGGASIAAAYDPEASKQRRGALGYKGIRMTMK